MYIFATIGGAVEETGCERRGVGTKVVYTRYLIEAWISNETIRPISVCFIPGVLFYD